MEIIPRCSPSLLPIVVNEISTFASNRGMELNHKKCKEMVILFLKYDVARHNPIYVCGLPAQSVSSFKLPGLTLSHDLSWNCHVETVIKKANSRLYALRPLKKAGLSQIDLVNTYCSFVRSAIEYAAPAWSNVTIHLSNLIECIQKQALRIIFPSSTYEDALAHSGLGTLEARREDLCKYFMRKLRLNNNANNNPVAQIINTFSQLPEHNYHLRTQSTNVPFTGRIFCLSGLDALTQDHFYLAPKILANLDNYHHICFGNFAIFCDTPDSSFFLSALTLDNSVSNFILVSCNFASNMSFSSPATSSSCCLRCSSHSRSR